MGQNPSWFLRKEASDTFNLISNSEIAGLPVWLSGRLALVAKPTWSRVAEGKVESHWSLLPIQAHSTLCPADGAVSPATSSSVRPPDTADGAKR